MPIPYHMNKVFTPQQLADVKAALQTAIDTLNSLQIVQLTKEERKKANAVSDKRLPYVQQTFQSLAPQYSELQPSYLPFAEYKNNFEMMEMLREVMPLVAELNDRYTDFSIASQHNAYTYMKHFYRLAGQTPKGKVVRGALSPLFTRPKHSKD